MTAGVIDSRDQSTDEGPARARTAHAHSASAVALLTDLAGRDRQRHETSRARRGEEPRASVGVAIVGDMFDATSGGRRRRLSDSSSAPVEAAPFQVPGGRGDVASLIAGDRPWPIAGRPLFTDLARPRLLARGSARLNKPRNGLRPSGWRIWPPMRPAVRCGLSPLTHPMDLSSRSSAPRRDSDTVLFRM